MGDSELLLFEALGDELDLFGVGSAVVFAGAGAALDLLGVGSAVDLTGVGDALDLVGVGSALVFTGVGEALVLAAEGVGEALVLAAEGVGEALVLAGVGDRVGAGESEAPGVGGYAAGVSAKAFWCIAKLATRKIALEARKLPSLLGHFFISRDMNPAILPL